LQAIPGQRGWPSELLLWKVQEEEWGKHKTSVTPAAKPQGGKSWLDKCVVNTMCTNFNESCQAYPCFNTPSHTNRSLKSADKPDELEHKKSKSGREPLPLCSQLGTGYPRPMGLAGNHQLPIRTYPNPTPGGTNSRDLMLEQIKISQEVGELLVKGAIIETQLSPSPNSSWWRRKEGAKGQS